MAKLSTRKRGKKWYYSFDAGTTPDGKRKRVEKGGYRTEKEALAEGTKELASFLSGNMAIASEKISVKDFLDEWLERKRMEVRPSTSRLYRAIIDRVNPLIGSKCLQKLRPRNLDDMMRKLAVKGLAYKTLSVTITVLRNALSIPS